MSKLIKMTDEYIKKCTEEFEDTLRGSKFTEGKISYTSVMTTDKQEKATIYISQLAWGKMLSLLAFFSKEVAWHGVAERIESDEDEHAYLISDILVYPQTVTATTVEMDEDKYAEWIMSNFEDERFNKIRMQGHSHVNMRTLPSGEDLKHQHEILDQLRDDDFYIFLIWNKSLEMTNVIYDMGENIFFEDKDVSICILDENDQPSTFIHDADSMVKEFTYTPYKGKSSSRKKTTEKKGKSKRSLYDDRWEDDELPEYKWPDNIYGDYLD